MLHFYFHFYFQFQDKMLGSRSWKFNSLLLSDKAFCDSLKDKLDIFLEINTIPETSPSIIWESFKAYAQKSQFV